MPIGTLKEVSQVVAVNSTALAISFTQIETGLKIALLLISVLYTLDKWLSHRKEVKENEQKKRQN